MNSELLIYMLSKFSGQLQMLKKFKLWNLPHSLLKQLKRYR